MSKNALVIPCEDRFKPMSEWTPIMMSRELCETDPQYLQVLPYITLFDEDSGDIFVYTRGSAGQETRLHSKRSIGLGGHIDELPGDRTIEQLIIDEACRELEEETGFRPSSEIVQSALFASVQIYAPQTDVDAVHMAVALQIPVKRSDLVKLEAGVIVDPQWFTPEQLSAYLNIERFTKPQVLLWTFETWSKILLELVLSGRAYKQHVRKWENDRARYRFYCDVVSAMREVGIAARIHAVRDLYISVPLWKTADGVGEGYVNWSLEGMERWTKLFKTIEGYVFSDDSGQGEVAVTPDFEHWEMRDASTLHPIAKHD